MTELNDVAKASIRSSFYLFLGQTSSAIIAVITSILVANPLGPENYGLYNVVLIVPLLGAINDVDIKNLVELTKYLPLISSVARRVLIFEEKILGLHAFFFSRARAALKYINE